MSELVKTGDELFQKMTISMGRDKFLILPDGLDKLEEIFRKKFGEEGYLNRNIYELISSVFARFKKENEI